MEEGRPRADHRQTDERKQQIIWQSVRIARINAVRSHGYDGHIRKGIDKFGNPSKPHVMSLDSLLPFSLRLP